MPDQQSSGTCLLKHVPHQVGQRWMLEYVTEGTLSEGRPAAAARGLPVAKDALHLVIIALLALHEGWHQLLLGCLLAPLSFVIIQLAAIPSSVIRVGHLWMEPQVSPCLAHAKLHSHTTLCRIAHHNADHQTRHDQA